MAVNTMGIEQAYSLIASLHEMATGQKTTTPTDESSFISVAQATLVNGYDPVLNAISQVIGRTLIAVRPYRRKFGGLEMSAERWGAIIRKINFIDTDPIANPTFALVDGSPVDQYVVKKPQVLETRYVGSDIWQGQYTIFTRQLDVAFQSAAEFASFMSGLMMHFSNEREQWLENMSRAAVANFIAGKNIIGGDGVVHLLTEYNTATGLSLTATTVRQPANFPAFVRWLYARVEELSKKMAERSVLFQQQITGKPIIRHTPVEDQKVYILADFMAHMQAEVLSDTYHDNYLRLADTEAVGYWQAIDNPDALTVTPVYVDNTGAVATGTSQVMTNVVGVMFDRDAIGYNIYQDTLDSSPYNAKGQYYNLFNNVRVQYQNDFTEKGIVLVLD